MHSSSLPAMVDSAGMFSIHVPKPWDLADNRLTDESVYWRRREILKLLGLGAMSLPLEACGEARDPEHEAALYAATAVPMRAGYPARLNPDFRDAGRPLTPEALATRHNTFYEFGVEKDEVWRQVGDFQVDPWTVEISGLVDKPGRYRVEDLEQLVPLEERRYRFRCVEAWAMTVPWTGLPLGALMDKLGVQSEARYVRFTTAHRPQQMPGVRAMDYYPWPYYECLSVAEARNELSLLGTGIYGKPLRKQNGAPLRLVVPWKYGLKSIKSIARIEFTKIRRGTFWFALAPDEYSWHSNVEPDVPHPKWSQATEQLIDDGTRVKTLPYNGYASYVAKLYA